MKLFVDDLRNPPDDTWTIARNSKIAIEYLGSELVTELALDHDLGGEDKAQSVLNWIEAKVYNTNDYLPPIITIHTSNPEGRKYLELTMQSIRRELQRRNKDDSVGC